MQNTPEQASGLTWEVALYIIRKFDLAVARSAEYCPFPANWDLEFLHEVNLAVEVLITATRNKRNTSWGVEDYVKQMTTNCTGRNSLVEKKLKKNFPPLFSPSHYTADPCVIADKDDKCLFWYLPGILTDKRRNQVWEDMQHLSKILVVNKGSKSWRTSPRHYNDKEGWLQPGEANLSPAWFQQGHEKTNHLEVSRNLRNDDTIIWLERIIKFQAIIGGILRIIQPYLFIVGINALSDLRFKWEEIGHSDYIPRILQVWGTLFNVISVISNRDTPFHRDNGSDHRWFDILSALGNYQNGVFEIPGIGLQVRYDPGTIIALLGRVLRHGAKCPGNRACVAFYMRKSVLGYLGSFQPSWSIHGDIIEDKTIVWEEGEKYLWSGL